MKKKIILSLTISILILAIAPGLASCAPAATPPTPTAPITPAKPVEEKPQIDVVKPAPETPATVTEAKVTGSVTYMAKIALPPGAVVEVKLQDVSRADAPAVTIGEYVITTSGNQVPFPFEIKYNPTAIDPRFTYAVRARITVDGELWFTSDKTYPVITQGNSSTVNVILAKVAAPVTSPAFENTTWVLQSYGQPGNLISVLKDREVTAFFDSAKARVSGSAGVNMYGGGYDLKDNKLSIPGPLISTLMAGPQPLMDQEKEFLTALQAAESYKIEGGKLTITCGGKALIFTKK